MGSFFAPNFLNLSLKAFKNEVAKSSFHINLLPYGFQNVCNEPLPTNSSRCERSTSATIETCKNHLAFSFWVPVKLFNSDMNFPFLHYKLLTQLMISPKFTHYLIEISSYMLAKHYFEWQNELVVFFVKHMVIVSRIFEKFLFQIVLSLVRIERW